MINTKPLPDLHKQPSWRTVCWRAFCDTGGLHWQCTDTQVDLASSRILHRLLTAWACSWPAENISGQTKRAVGLALQITVGDLGAVTGVLLYRPAYSAHRFRKPHIIAIGYLTLSIVVASGLWFHMACENRRREEKIAAGKDEEVDYETRVLLGDRDVHWRYTV
jgi:hypothetical protein